MVEKIKAYHHLVFQDGYQIIHPKGDRQDYMLVKPGELFTMADGYNTQLIHKELKINHTTWIKRWIG